MDDLVQRLRDDMAEQLHRWPGGAPNGAWSALEALTHEITECNATIEHVGREYERVERERDDVRKYAEHQQGCRKWKWDAHFDADVIDADRPCTCRLDAALGATSAETDNPRP